jgi:hypothetical protein
MPTCGRVCCSALSEGPSCRRGRPTHSTTDHRRHVVAHAVCRASADRAQVYFAEEAAASAQATGAGRAHRAQTTAPQPITIANLCEFCVIYSSSMNHPSIIDTTPVHRYESWWSASVVTNVRRRTASAWSTIHRRQDSHHHLQLRLPWHGTSESSGRVSSELGVADA